MATGQKEVVVPTLDDVVELLCSSPLYSALKFNPSSHAQESQIIYFVSHADVRFDSYCPACGDQTTYAYLESLTPSATNGWPIINYVACISMRCARNDKHRIEFLLSFDNHVIRKIGQYPSAFDVGHPSLREYKDVLSPSLMKDFKYALGGISAGIGAGSLIYLRRIFESLVSEARDEVAQEPGWNQEAYSKARMAEKIAMLKDRLPPYLVDNRTIYGLMSAGVHNLSEEQCLMMFPVIQAGIELILDEHLRERRRRDKAEQNAVDIQRLNDLLSRAAPPATEGTGEDS